MSGPPQPNNSSDTTQPSIEAFVECLSLVRQDGGRTQLENAIKHGKIVLSQLPAGLPLRTLLLDTLALFFSNLYDQTSDVNTLESAIEYGQKALDLTPPGNPDRAEYLNNFSLCLNTRYEREGNLKDLTQAIEYGQEAVDLMPFGTHRAKCLNNLSIRLGTRYERKGNLEDLTQAIEYSQKAVDLTPLGNPDRTVFLNSLGNRLSARYRREGNLEDLTQAIEYSQKAVDLTPPDNHNRAIYLNNLSNRLGTRYERKGNLKDLNQAIEYSQKAIDLTPPGKPDRAGRFSNLSIHLSTRYEREDNFEDLTHAIEYSQKALDLTPFGNPNRAAYLMNISDGLRTRYEREGNLEDLTQAIEHSECAVNCLSSPPSIRVRGCLYAVKLLAQLQKWQEARTVLEWGLEILPSLISNLSSKLDQENMMKSVSGLAAIGCAVSLESSSDAFEAIRILELSRGTISRLTLDSRSDISELYRNHSDLAKQFDDLRSIINTPTENREEFGRNTLSRESALSKLRDLVDRIRDEEGFEDFQDLPSKDKLLGTLSNHSTVFLNTTSIRTDAILIRGDQTIQVLPLERSIFQSSQEYHARLCTRFGWDGYDEALWVRANTGMRDFLAWLWDQVVGPVLSAFGFEALDALSAYSLPESLLETARLARQRQTEGSTGYPTNKLAYYQELMDHQPIIASSVSSMRSRTRARAPKKADTSRFPRVHWIGIGHMGAFPFHAAGHGSQDARRNTMSCVLSSYASTLTTRVYAKQKLRSLDPKPSALLLVAMPKTPGESDLPGVDDEVQVIQDTLQGRITVKLHKSPPPSVDVVVRDLPDFDCAHFACHGYADPRSPFRSGLLLCGNEPDKAFDQNTRDSVLTVNTVSSAVDTQRSLLAFLSACCTAENAASLLIDEGIHLASGFQLAGFPHVIASLWEANDALSVTVARRFYQILFDRSEIEGHDRIAYALHDAVLAARRIDDDPLSWATTVHFGP